MRKQAVYLGALSSKCLRLIPPALPRKRGKSASGVHERPMLLAFHNGQRLTAAFAISLYWTTWCGSTSNSRCIHLFRDNRLHFLRQRLKLATSESVLFPLVSSALLRLPVSRFLGWRGEALYTAESGADQQARPP